MSSQERPELTTARLLLRPYHADDLEVVHAYGADAEVSRYQPWGPNSEAETRQFLEQSMQENAQPERTAFHFAIVLRESKQLIGGCTLRITNIVQREAMIGYTLGCPHWGQGYTTEAARALLALAFEELQLHRVTSWCTPENIGSWRVMEKIGMRREGHELEAIFFKEQWHDWYRYAILDREWKPAV